MIRLILALLFYSSLDASEIDILEHKLAKLIPGHENYLYEAPEPDKENIFQPLSLHSPRFELREHSLFLASALPEKRLLNDTLYEYYPFNLESKNKLEERYHLFAYFDLVAQEDEISAYNLSLAVFLRSDSVNFAPYIYYIESKVDLHSSQLKINDFWRDGIHLKFSHDKLIKADIPSLPALEFKTPLGDMAKINLHFK